jgi:hypothetical protein
MSRDKKHIVMLEILYGWTGVMFTLVGYLLGNTLTLEAGVLVLVIGVVLRWVFTEG